jgi:tetratricopeptide (TPR) repeat protein
MGRVLLVGWDCGDWGLFEPLADAGVAPCVARSIAGGAMGSLAGTFPPAPAPLWTSIATGLRADGHGILADEAFDHDEGGFVPASSAWRSAPALWELASSAGRRCIVANWAAVEPAEPVAGTCVDGRFFAARGAHGAHWPIDDGSVHPADAAARLADLRIHPAELDVGEMEAFLPRLRATSLADDPRPLEVAGAIAESAGVHAVFTELLERETWDLAMVRIPLLGRLAHFARFRGPRLGTVTAEDHARYGSVVDAACMLLDGMLARATELAGPGTTVIVASPMGLRAGDARPADPRAAAAGPQWHRRHGMLLVSGPGVRADQLIHGASILDLAPTVLALLGVTATADMPGRVLAEAFERPPEDRRGAPGSRPPGSVRAGAVTPWESSAAVRVLTELGYAPTSKAEDERRRRSEAAAEFVRAVSRMEAGDPASAVAPLRRACELDPADPRTRLWLAACLLGSGERDEARRLADETGGAGTFAPFAALVLGMVEGDAGNHAAALEHLRTAERTSAAAVTAGTLLHCQLSRTLLALGQAEDAERTALQACEIDPDCRSARLALSAALLARGRPRDAADEALKAIGMQFRWPAAHLQLGMALAQLGRLDESIRAIETSISQGATAEAHDLMARVLARASWDTAAVSMHRDRARELRAGTSR